ncbi:unnamed protein product [Candidula unifasciata]|uniref:Very-long-chain (3R)-3-hydroxyacyl-CoA dehydratase n=1 Tax=Candidula unifasciata TaxID=100452 RepID=A0A8S3ZF88_9EUPU|nr:unnamed protein product [Candidula unifasciata]
MASSARPSRPVYSEGKAENSLTKAYLVAYNVSQMLGWSAILFIVINYVLTKNTVVLVYREVEPILQVCQTAAVLEIIHSMAGLVKSNWIITAFQVYSRVFLLWGVVWSVPATQNGVSVILWLSAWTIAEVIRYAYYFFSLLPGPVPHLLVWCRYTFFIILYPIGVTGELMTVFNALPYVKETRLYSIELPNPWNCSFSYYYYLCFMVISYLPVFPQLYLHMFRQRKKVLGGALDRLRKTQ